MEHVISSKNPPRITFQNLSRVAGLFHGVFTRRGGVSAPPYESLNVAANNGDSIEAVGENLARVKETAGVEWLVSSNQVHGDGLNFIDAKAAKKLEVRAPMLISPPGDALSTNMTDLGLLIKIADCQSILLVDPDSRVIANIHSGWRGSVLDIAGKTVRSLKRLGLNPAKTLAAVSPSLGPCCAEFINYKREIPEKFWPFRVGPLHFDFWALTRSQLTAAGLREENIEIAAKCTVCGKADFFSYRGEGETGRMASIIGWKRP
ncbi:MAG: polyphenol oxidase family protein [Syntrophobacteraceae bacterium]|nr:polyphenol oxidase family protein [Syntrophobacteraceae bacterium]